MSLVRKVAVRLAIFAASLLVASVVIFAICSALPGDVAQVMLGANADPRAVEQMRVRLGLDQPLWLQYLHWISGLLSGDLGTSVLSRRSVSSQLADKLPVTAWLVVWAMLVSIIVSVPLGMLAALRRRRLSGTIVSILAQVGLAIPAFWAGIMATFLFAVTWHWLPANGYVPLTQDPGAWASHLVLPVAALAVVQSAVLVRYVRSATLEVLDEDHFRTARAIGLREWPALLRHGLRNASLSVVTVLGLQLATMLVGAIVVESVFALPGLGSLLLAAVSQRDLVLVQGTVMVLVFAVLVINTLVDLSYLVLDPRLRVEGR